MTTMTPHSRVDRSRGRSIMTPPVSLMPVEADRDIMAAYRHSPIEDLLASHNLGRKLPAWRAPELLIVTCMDHRVTLDIPEYFAFQLRTAGATPMPVFSNIAFAVGAAQVRAICVIAHTDCAMCRLDSTTDAMIDGLVEREGWHEEDVRAQIDQLNHGFRIADPVRSAVEHASCLAQSFPTCVVAPLLYRVEDGALMQISARTVADETSAGMVERARVR